MTAGGFLCSFHVAVWQATTNNNTSGRSLEFEQPPAPKSATFSQIKNNIINNNSSLVEVTNLVATTHSKQKPRFVWHVGPMKTGTTSIQAELVALWNVLLEQDNWFFASQNAPFHGVKKPDFVQRFTNEMTHLHQQGRNVVLSNENYSVFYREADYARIAQALGEEWDVTIVIGYRPYYEWVPSMWSQTHKLKLKEQSGQYDSPWHQQRILPMFPNYYEKISQGYLFADSVVRMIQPYFSNIVLLDLYGADHQGGENTSSSRSLPSRFLCDILQAPTACAASRSRIEQRVNQGSLEPIHANAVALAAAQAGLIDTEHWQQPAVMEALLEHWHSVPHQPTGSGDTVAATAAYELPMVCPNATAMDNLWQQTLDKEAQIFPSLAQQDPDREAHLRQGLDEKIVQKTYCHVDAARVLEDQNDFFKTFA